MAEIVYPPVIALAHGVFRALDISVTTAGSEYVPRQGGAVLACNHVSYLDFIFCGVAARPSGRLVRFMAKQEVFTHRVSGPLMRGMHHIPVDRQAGAASYRRALEALRRGEIVGVFPEATISRSFVLKELKTGAIRMAMAAGVPLVPVVTWGGQRLLTKGQPRHLRRHVPVTIRVGEPITPPSGAPAAEVTATLADRMTALLDQLQRDYPDAPAGPQDRWWQPAHLGGTAPTPAEAARLDAEEVAARR